MRKIKLIDMYTRICRSWLGDPSEITYSLTQRNQVVDEITRHVKTGMEHAFWPDFDMCEERPFRAQWCSTTTYAANNEVYDDGIYYKALQASAGKTPADNADFWEEIEELNRYLPYEPLGAYPLGEIDAIAYENLHKNPKAKKYNWQAARAGIWVHDCTAATVWVKYRLRPPRFTMDAFDAEAEEGTYNVNDIVYIDGDTKQLQVDSTGKTYLVLIPVPYILEEYIYYGALRTLVKDPAKQAEYANRRDKALDDAVCTYCTSQTEPRNIEWEGF